MIRRGVPCTELRSVNSNLHLTGSGSNGCRDCPEKMKKSFLMIIVLAFSYCEASNRVKHLPPDCTTAIPKTLRLRDTTATPDTLESLTLKEVTEITELINERRQEATPPPSNMNRIIWDSRLAVEAKNALRDCSTKEKTLNHAILGELGFSMASTIVKSVSVAVKAWYSQLENFNPLDNVCFQYKECRDYTQMMFAKTKAIGCYWNRCLPQDNGYILGCAYYPKYKTKDALYTSGTPPCSRCTGEDGGLCYNGLCSTKAECQYLYPCECNLKCQFGAELNTTSCRCNCDEIIDHKYYDSLDCSDPCEDCKEETTTVQEETTTTSSTASTTVTTNKPPSSEKATSGQEAILKSTSFPMNMICVMFLMNYN